MASDDKLLTDMVSDDVERTYEVATVMHTTNYMTCNYHAV